MVRPLLFTFTFACNAVAATRPIVLYQFDRDTKTQIIDSSGVNPPAHLEIPNNGALKRTPGALTLVRPTLLTTKAPPAKLINAVQKSGEITISAWITPANLNQNGPARIVTLSRGSSNRNVTLGQDASKFDARFRTERTGPNGIPSLSSGKVIKKLTHIVFTRSRNGLGTMFINGRQSGQRSFAGLLKNWDHNYRFALGNELTHDRPLARNLSRGRYFPDGPHPNGSGHPI